MVTKNLIIEGGAVKGIAALGALQYMHDQEILENIVNYAGTSIGGVICLLLNIGFTPSEIKNEVFSRDFEVLLNDSCILKLPYNLFRNYGLHTGKKFISLLESFLQKKDISKSVTLKELYDKTHKTLVVTGSNITKRKTIFFNWQTHPDMKVLEAIRITISIPLFFTAVKFEGDIYVDGGVLNNYPLYYFDEDIYKQGCLHLYKDSDEIKDKVMTLNSVKIEEYIKKTIGIRTINSTNEEQSSELYTGSTGITGITSFIKAIISSMITENERRYIESDYWTRSIAVEIPYYVDITDFNPPENKKEDMYSRGLNTAKKFFEEDCKFKHC